MTEDHTPKNGKDAFISPPDASHSPIGLSGQEDDDGLTSPSSQSPQHTRRTEHSYHDYVLYPPDGSQLCATPRRSSNFPAKLHKILSNPEHAYAISWQPHGRAWRILDKTALMEQIIPQYLAQSKFESFTRQLSGWGFKRLYQSGPDCNCYYHECFLKGMPQLTCMMKRKEENQGRQVANAGSEPNFYEMDRMNPLPDSTTQYNQEAGVAAAGPPPLFPNPYPQPVPQWNAYYAQGPPVSPPGYYHGHIHPAQPYYPQYHMPSPLAYGYPTQPYSPSYYSQGHAGYLYQHPAMAHPNQQPQLQQPVPGLNQQHATTHMQPQAKYPYAAAYPSQYAQQQQVDPRRQLKDEFPHDKESDE